MRSKTQQQVADHMNISQNTYSYWESGKVNISSDDMQRLAVFSALNIDFLSGRPYRMKLKPHEWRIDLYRDYQKAKDDEKVFMEYLYGNIVYVDEANPNDNIVNNPIECIDPLSEQEKTLIEMFRATTEEGRIRMIQSIVNIHDQMEEKKNASSTTKNA